MGRYVYKPLLIRFDAKPGDIDYEEKKYDFIQAYKHSLMSGELFVDLYNYDIYVANNGVEYPVPATMDIKKEIIDWIESDEGPLASLKKNDILDTKTNNTSEATITRKKEKIKNLIKTIEDYKKACEDKIFEDENTLLMTQREVETWFKNLSGYALDKAYSGGTDKSDIVKIVYSVLCKYINLYERLINVLIYSSEMTSVTVTTSFYQKSSKYISSVDELNEKNLLELSNLASQSNGQKQNSLYYSAMYIKTASIFNDLRKIFRGIINNRTIIDYKLDKNDFVRNDNYIVPTYEFKMVISGLTENDSTKLEKSIGDTSLILYNDSSEIKIFTRDYNFENNELTIKISNEKWVNKE